MSTPHSSTGEEEPDVFKEFKTMKMPNLMALLSSKPNNIMSGAVSGLGSTICGAVIAVGV
jgi:hypothetical protein